MRHVLRTQRQGFDFISTTAAVGRRRSASTLKEICTHAALLCCLIISGIGKLQFFSAVRPRQLVLYPLH